MKMTTYDIVTGNEPNTLRVCERCLWAIESREGNQRALKIYVDEENESECTCDWCGESCFDVLYEI